MYKYQFVPKSQNTYYSHSTPSTLTDQGPIPQNDFSTKIDLSQCLGHNIKLSDKITLWN